MMPNLEYMSLFKGDRGQYRVFTLKSLIGGGDDWKIDNISENYNLLGDFEFAFNTFINIVI